MAAEPSANGQAKAELPVIVVTPERVKEINDQAVRSLKGVDNLYERADRLVRVIQDGAATRLGPKRAIVRFGNAPRVCPLSYATLHEEMAAAACWAKPRGKKLVATYPPKWAVSGVRDRAQWDGIRRLIGIACAPTMRPDGSVITLPGYDRDTGIIYCPSADYPPLQKRPTYEDARRACDDIMGLVSEFPVEDNCNLATWLAAVLTVLARPAIDGPCPLLLFDAPTPGTGKTMLAELVGLITNGRETSVTELSDDNEEVRKAIVAILLAGDSVINFDNVTGAFGCKSLDAALTGTTYHGRILGRSQMTSEMRINTVFLASGNNVTLRGDTPRRVVPCRLVATCERPEERSGFKIPNLKEHVRQRHPELAIKALTILHEFNLAGRPQAGLPVYGSFEAWSDLIRQAVYRVFQHDPLTARGYLRTETRVGNVNLAAVLDGWSRLPGGQDPQHGVTARRALEIVSMFQAQHAALREALTEWRERDDRSKGELPDPNTLGRRLRSARDRVAGGWRLRVTELTTDNTRGWYVEHVG